jgi:5-formyltetrahydrofolate cyclo-ligase
MNSPDAGVDALKGELRRMCTARRDAIPAGVRLEAALQITETGIGFAAAPVGAMVSAYSAMGSEIDPGPLLARLHREGYRTCLPVVQPRGNPLVFGMWSPGDPLVARTWGIREPASTAAVVQPDILLVPLLAFDRRGVRLGYGGGYYDRTLQILRRLKPIIAIGLAFPEQEITEVPRGPFDQPLDWVLGPAAILKID